jgi:hypothetical protein
MMTCSICGFETPFPHEHRSWRWRNLREASIGITLLLFPWQWRLYWESVSAYDDWHVVVVVGPLVIRAEASYGNCSTGDWRARFGMSDTEAWERSE